MPPPNPEKDRSQERARIAPTEGNQYDANKFRKDLEARAAGLKAVIDQNPNIAPEDKGQLWTSVEQTVDRFMDQLGGELTQLEESEGAARQQVLEQLNLKATALLRTIRKALEGGHEKVVDSEKVLREVAQANFDQHLARLNMHVDGLRRLYGRLSEVKVEGGVMEAVFGKMQAFYEKEIAKLTEQIQHEYANLAVLAQLTNPNGLKKLDRVKDTLNFYASNFKSTGFWSEVGGQVTTKAGVLESWAFLKNYTTGVVKGVLTMVDPRTYILLAEKMGEATASLIFCDDNWAKVQTMIKGAGDAWNNADANAKADMLGQFMGSILGTKGLGMATKAGRVAVLGRARGTVLAADVGEVAGAAARRVGTGISAGAGRAAEAVGGAARRVGAAGRAGAERVSGAVRGAAEFVANTLKPALESVSRTITRLRGRLASIGDAEMQRVMKELSAAESAVREGVKLSKKGKGFADIKYFAEGGEGAFKHAQRDIVQLSQDLNAALASKNIMPAVRAGLVQVKEAAGRLGVAMRSGAETGIQTAKGVPGRIGAGAGKAAEAVGGAARRVGAAGRAGAERVSGAVRGAAEFVANTLKPALESVSRTITRLRGRLASIGDAEMQRVMKELSAAESAVREGVKLSKKGKGFADIKYFAEGGEGAFKHAQRDIVQLSQDLNAALASKNIMPAVRAGLVQVKEAAGRLGVAMRSGAEAGIQTAKGVPGRIGAGAGKAAEAVGGAARRAGAAGRRGVEAGRSALARGAEFVANTLKPALERVSAAFTKLRGRLASIGDTEMRELMGNLKRAEAAVQEGNKLAPKGEISKLMYGTQKGTRYRVNLGRSAFEKAQNDVARFTGELEKALAAKDIAPAVRTRLVAVKEAAGRLGLALRSGAETGAQAVKGVPGRVSAGAGRAAEAVGGAARRAGAAGRRGVEAGRSALARGAEFVAATLKPALESVSRTITRLRGKLASITDGDMRVLMHDITQAEKAVQQGIKLGRKGKGFVKLEYGRFTGQRAFKEAQKAVLELSGDLDKALAAKNIMPAVKAGLVSVKEAAGRLGLALRSGAETGAQAVKGVPGRVSAGAGRAAEAVGGAARRVGAAGKRGVEAVGGAAERGRTVLSKAAAEFVKNQLQPALARIDRTITRLRGKLASFTDVQMRELMENLNKAEAAIAKGPRNLRYAGSRGKKALTLAKRHVRKFSRELDAALARKDIMPDVRVRLTTARAAVGRLNAAMRDIKFGKEAAAGPVIEGIAGRGVAPFRPSFEGVAYASNKDRPVSSEEEIPPAEAETTGEPETAPPQVDRKINLADKGGALGETFDKYSEYRLGEWRGINRSVAELIGITEETYDEERFRETVRDIQTALRADPDGRPLVTDGKIGPITMAAITAWKEGKDKPGNQYANIALEVDLTDVTSERIAQNIARHREQGAA